MIELTKNSHSLNKTSQEEILQLRHVKGSSVYITDPEGNMLEIKTTEEGSKIVFTRDESGKCLAIEERVNGTKLYHVSSDSTGLPSTHEIRTDNTEIVYFFNIQGNLQHLVELKTNGDRVSTIIGQNGSIFSIEQKQIGGIIFQGWVYKDNVPKEGMIWLHSDGTVSTYGSKSVVDELYKKFSRFLDGVAEI